MVSEEEYVRYVGRYTDMVLRIAVNYCKEYSDAEDITQDVFLKLYETKTDFADSEHIKRWLIRVTVNQCKNYLASAWRRRMQPMEFQKIESVLETAGGELWEDAEAYALLEAVASLPGKYRIVVHLYYYEDYQVKDWICFISIMVLLITAWFYHIHTPQIVHLLMMILWNFILM